MSVAPVAAAAVEADQAVRVVGVAALAGNVVSVESASGAEIIAAARPGEAQGEAKIVNGARDAAIGTGNLVINGGDAAAG